MRVRFAYFKALPGKEDITTDYDVDLNEGETIISVEQCLVDGGYSSDWYRVYIQVPE